MTFTAGTPASSFAELMKRLILFATLLLGAIGGIAWWMQLSSGGAESFTLYGNVEQREVSLAFNSNERVLEVLVEEGERVRQGQVVATLDTSRLEPQVAQADAQVAAQLAVVDRMRNGNRPEEIEQARANLSSARADAANARQQYQRLTALREQNLASAQQADSAKATLDAAEARVQSVQKALDLQIAGVREEEIVQAEAQLRGSEAQLALLRRQLDEANLIAPVNGIVRARLLEPGEMASPQKPAFSVLIMEPKWIRAYVTETELGLLKPGAAAHVEVDAFPGKRFEGRVGYISSVAEFTPKNVQTEDLRTSLVYQVRVLVTDPDDNLRLGMPATVRVLADDEQPSADEPATEPQSSTPAGSGE